MNRYDLIAFDMDGTLLDSNHQITQDSLDAIDAAVNAGKTVILSTGRSLSELKITARCLNISAILSAKAEHFWSIRTQTRSFTPNRLNHLPSARS